MTTFTAWFKERLPKIYLINSSSYPTFEYPHGSGVMHEYPHYQVFGKRLPSGHLGLIGILGLFSVYKLYSWTKSAPKSDAHHPVTASKDASAVVFPAPKRDFEKEKEEFIASYLAHQGIHHGH